MCVCVCVISLSCTVTEKINGLSRACVLLERQNSLISLKSKILVYFP